MNKDEFNALEDKLVLETEKLGKLRNEYNHASSEYLSELAADCERSEGSGDQEARRESRQNDLRTNNSYAERALVNQRKVVADLTLKYNNALV